VPYSYFQTSERSRGTLQSWARERWALEQVEEELRRQSIRQPSTAWWWREWAQTSTHWRSNTRASRGGSSSRLCNSTYAQVGGQLTTIITVWASFIEIPTPFLTFVLRRMASYFKSNESKHFDANDDKAERQKRKLSETQMFDDAVWLVGPGPKVATSPGVLQESSNTHSDHTDGTCVEPSGHLVFWVFSRVFCDSGFLQWLPKADLHFLIVIHMFW